MREYIQSQYGVEILRWDEPTEDGSVLFEAIADGYVLRADSLALLLSLIQEHTHRPLVLSPANAISWTFERAQAA